MREVAHNYFVPFAVMIDERSQSLYLSGIDGSAPSKLSKQLLALGWASGIEKQLVGVERSKLKI
jgi:hypothetical protein